MNYFKNCNTLDDAKKLYYELAMELHPDKNLNRDTTYLFQELQNQFEAFKPGKEKFTNEFSEHKPKDYIYVINELIKIMETSPGLLVTVNGSFIWVSGNSYPVRAEIKGILKDGKTDKFPDQMLKVGFASKKSQWYFSPKSYKKRTKKVLSYERIQDIYGNEEIKNEANTYKQKMVFA